MVKRKFIIYMAAIMAGPSALSAGAQEAKLEKLLDTIAAPNSFPPYHAIQPSAPTTPVWYQSLPSGALNVSSGSAPAGTGQANNPYQLRMNLLKYMMGPGDTSHNVSQSMSVAREGLQTARDQEEQARDSFNSISGESSRSVRADLAYQVSEHADAAREAADRAYSAACSCNSSSVNDIAEQARSAANEAQALADRAQGKVGD